MTDSNGQTDTVTSSFTINLVAPQAPTVVINSPAANASYSYYAGNPAPTIPFSATATAGYGPISTLSATLDGAPITLSSVSGLGTTQATALATLSVAAGGIHTLAVTTTDACGVSATSTSTFTVNVLTPSPPTVVINSPAAGASFDYNVCNGPTPVSFSFTGTSPNGVVTNLSATLDGNPIVFSGDAYGSPTANESATLELASGGSHQLVVTVTDSFGGTSSATLSFNINALIPPNPTVVINSPAPNTTYTYTVGDPALSIPFSFTGTSTAGTVQSLTATLDGNPITVTLSGVGTSSATGTANLQLTAGGQHTIAVAVVDSCADSATASSTFTINVVTPQPPTVSINAPLAGAAYTQDTCAAPLQIPFQFTGTALSGDVASLSATLDGVAIAYTTVGLGSPVAVGSATLSPTTAGTHNIVVTVTDTYGGTASANSSFTVTLVAPPLPTVVINTPSANSSYNYTLGGSPVSIPFRFTGSANYGTITALTATLDGTAISFTPNGLGTVTATGTATLSLTSVGNHVLAVSATDSCGDIVSTSSNFTIVGITPPPSVVINSPSAGAAYTHNTCASPLQVSLKFTGTTPYGTISSLTATLDGSPITLTTSGLGTALAVGTATLSPTTAGTHTVSVTVKNSGGAIASATSSFTVAIVAPAAPTVVINTPANGSVYTYTIGGPAVQIPLSFTGTALYGTVTALSATLDGKPVTISVSGIGTAQATGTATLSLTSACSHSLVVSVTDSCCDVAKATSTFTVNGVNPPPPPCITGCVFFDANCNGCLDKDEPGICGITVSLCTTSGKVISTCQTASDGTYCFQSVSAGNYLVCVGGHTGLTPSTDCDHPVTVSKVCVTAPCTGYSLCWNDIQKLSACGHSADYWKCNLDQAICGQTCGSKETPVCLKTCTLAIGSFGLAPFACLTESQASSTLGCTSSDCLSQLSKQLLCAEYNYEKGCYIANDSTLTCLFVYWGEYVEQHCSSYSSSYLQFAQKWFAAYNCTDQGRGATTQVCGPNP